MVDLGDQGHRCGAASEWAPCWARSWHPNCLSIHAALACLHLGLALHEERESSSHLDSASHSIAATCCRRLAAEAPVPTWVQPCKGIKMWHLWAPSQRAWKMKHQAAILPRGAAAALQINTFNQKYLACRCLAFWWIALIFYRKQILFFFFSGENTLKKFNFPFKEQMVIENF